VKGNAIPKFYWKTTTESVVSVDGSEFTLSRKVFDFPISIQKHVDVISLLRIDKINHECILGYEVLDKYSPSTLDSKSMVIKL